MKVAEHPSLSMTMTDGKMYIVTHSTPSFVVQISGVMKAVDCMVSPWSPWGACSDQNNAALQCGHGLQKRKRDVLVYPKYGGKRCPWVQASRMCSAGMECCSGGMVWSNIQYDFECSGDGGTTSAKQWQIGKCRCPQSRPVYDASKQTCSPGIPCHASQCSHLHCMFMAGRIQVFHKGREEENGAQHKCTHQKGVGRLPGGCSCVCFDTTDEPADSTASDSSVGVHSSAMDAIEELGSN